MGRGTAPSITPRNFSFALLSRVVLDAPCLSGSIHFESILRIQPRTHELNQRRNSTGPWSQPQVCATPGGGAEMQTLFSKILITTVAALPLISVSAFPSVHHGKSSGKSSGSGSSHGGHSHFSSNGHSNTHSSLSFGHMNGNHVSSGHMFSNRTSGSHMTSAHINSTHIDSTATNRGQTGLARVDPGRTSGGSYRPYAPAERFSPYRASGDFARSSASEGRMSAPSAASRDFARSAASQSVRSSGSARGDRDLFASSFANSSGRTISTGGAWHSFGNAGAVSRQEIPTGYRTDSRPADSQWHSFATSRPAVVAENHSQFASLGASRAAASAFPAARQAFHSSRYSINTLGSSRFPSFSSFTSASSFSSHGSSPNFEGGPFASSRFGSSGFGTSSLGSSGTSLLASSSSWIPNLLFGGLLRMGSAALGGWVTLGETALSLAVRAIDYGLGSNGFGQAAFAGDPSFGQNGFAWNSGFAQVPAGCNSGPNFRTPDWTLSAYCGPYTRYYLGEPTSGHPNFGYNAMTGVAVIE